jgi:uncharacterized protein
MGKILLWAVIVLAGLTVWRIYNARAARAGRPSAPAPAPAARPESQAETMVRCAHCGIHLPRSEALMTQGQTWCGPEHARLGVKQP